MTVPRGKPHWWTQTQSSLPLCKSSGHSSTEKIKRKSAYVSSLAIGKLLWMPIAQSQVTHFNLATSFSPLNSFYLYKKNIKEAFDIPTSTRGKRISNSNALLHLSGETRLWDANMRQKKSKRCYEKNKRNKKPGQKALNMFKSHHILSGSYNYTSACHKEFKSDEWIF